MGLPDHEVTVTKAWDQAGGDLSTVALHAWIVHDIGASPAPVPTPGYPLALFAGRTLQFGLQAPKEALDVLCLGRGVFQQPLCDVLLLGQPGVG